MPASNLIGGIQGKCNGTPSARAGAGSASTGRPTRASRISRLMGGFLRVRKARRRLPPTAPATAAPVWHTPALPEERRRANENAPPTPTAQRRLLPSLHSPEDRCGRAKWRPGQDTPGRRASLTGDVV